VSADGPSDRTDRDDRSDRNDDGEVSGATAARRPGLYLHIPFCSAICPYCDFAVLTGGRQRRAEFVESLVAEIEMWRGEAGRWGTFDTVYFGGGTPSALQPEEIARLLAAVRAALPVAADAWVALEANPEDVTAESVDGWRELAVSMLSLGAQSFDAGTLRFLGRRHTPEQAREAVVLALAAGFPTVSVDLIYGADEWGHAARVRPPGSGHSGRGLPPGGKAQPLGWQPQPRPPGGKPQPRPLGREPRPRPPGSGSPRPPGSGSNRMAADPAARWQRDLEQVVEIAPHHVSCYQLTIHEGTPFGFRAARGELSELPDAAQAELFRFTHSYLAGRGYAAYEVSNFARAAEHQSRHNRKYWDHTPYLGLGPSAHSFDGRRRWWNERRLRPYQARLATGEKPVAGGEVLGRRELALEEVMLALRTATGLDLAGFQQRHGFDLASRNRRLVADLASAGLLAESGSRLMPTLEGLAVADSLARWFDVDAGAGEPSPSILPAGLEPPG
jgi:coproporphyrinogen III oxidase-like Fe-S oxidoreductase